MMKWIGLCISILAVVGFGFALANCGDDGDGGECKRTADCQSKYGETYYCDLNSKTCVCSPACNGKCCGDDGCGGTCPDECTAGMTCNANCECQNEGGDCTNGDRQCNNNVAEVCQGEEWVTAEDCTPAGETCVNGACQASGCTDGDYQCNGNVSEVCSGGNWTQAEDCSVAGEVCDGVTGQCEPAGGCTQGDTRCNSTIIQTCNAGGTWDDGTDCNDTGQACSDGDCIDIQVGDECPDGQECTDITGEGYMGCTEGGAIPAGNQAGCDENNPCPANQTCVGDGDGGTVCVANCGTCDTDELCEVIGQNGGKGCLPLDGSFPNPEDCANNGCTGNATCWISGQDGFCIPNCTLDGACTGDAARCDGDIVVSCTGGAWVPGQNCANSGETCFNGACASSDLCPAGQSCDVVSGEATGCLEGGQVPANNQTGCAGAGCDGNFGCWCNDAECNDSVCIENCGVCPAGTECQEVAAGSFGCLTADGQVPGGSQEQCHQTPCTGNASCWWTEVNVSSVCIDNCSVPH